MLMQTVFLEYPLTVQAHWVGGDLTVLCTGGSRPHLGGCAMAVPYRRPGGCSAAVSSLAAPGHQDAVLAGAAAGRLCRRLGCTVLVQCGIHYDNLAPEALQELQARVLDLCDQLGGPV